MNHNKKAELYEKP